jgi:hypothetical protein
MPDSAIIKRGLKIDGEQELYKILVKYPNACVGELLKFKNKFHLYLYGCPCNKDVNANESLEMYKNLTNIDDKSKIEFKEKMNVSFIQFNLNNKEIFRW